MLPRYLIVVAALLAAAPAAAQETSSRQAVPRREAPPQEAPQRSAPPERAEPTRREPPARVGRSRIVPPSRTESGATPTPARVAPAPAQESSSGSADQRRAVPRGSRPQGDNPRVGTAVPRPARPAPPVVDRGGRTDPPVINRGGRTTRGRTVIVRPPVVNHYYSYPRRYYPYGYGAFGLGYFYYDPYRWYGHSYPSGFYSGRYQGYRGFGFDTGEVRLDVSPRHAQVFVDGYYAGVVDDYDGVFQALKLESGAYRIEIVAPGYEPLEFAVRISPRQKITYRGDLIRLP